MQKGKGHREDLGRALIILALVAAISQGRSLAADSWERGMGGVMLPRLGHPAARSGLSGYLIALVTAANPFSVPGLYESAVSVALVRRRWSALAAWERTGTEGYSRDLLEASAGVALPGDFCHLTAIVGADITEVTGFGSEKILLSGCRISIELSHLIIVEAEFCAPAGERGERATARVGGWDSCMILSLGRSIDGKFAARAGGVVPAAGPLHLLGGYDVETGETSGGIMLTGSVPAAFSWSIHPVLGTTCSLSIGALR
jgi:hypothetical protein